MVFGIKIVKEGEFKDIVKKAKSFDNILKGLYAINTTAKVQSDILGQPGYGFPYLNQIIPLKWYYLIYIHTDVVRTILRVLRQETFKNGYELVVDKKEGEQDEETMKRIEIEEQAITKFFEKINENGQSLIDLLSDIEDDLNLIDNAYIMAVKRYYIDDEKNEIVKSKVVEFVRADPLKMKLIIGKDGEYGVEEDGKRIRFCVKHRDRKLREEDVKCPVCGLNTYYAKFVVEADDGEKYYSDDEVIHIKKYTAGIGYGISPLLAAYTKILILHLAERYLHMKYYMQRPPQNLLVVRTSNPEEFIRQWEWLLDKTKENPHLLYPLIVSGGAEDKGKFVENITFSDTFNESDVLTLIEKIKRDIGAIYGVSPLFMSQTEASGGLNNEGLQITITNRVISFAQKIYNNKVLPWMAKQMGVRYHKIKIAPVEARDEDAIIDRINRKLDVVERLKNLGYEVVIKQQDDGDITFTIVNEKPKEEVEEQPEEETKATNEQTLQGEPERSRPSKRKQRFEGEPQLPRK